MKPSRKQAVIIGQLRFQPSMTLAEAAWFIGGEDDSHQLTRTGRVLSNAVQRGMLRRLKPGVFALPEKKGELL